MTQQVRHRPIKCKYRLWSQTCTKVNESHHGDNPPLRPIGIQTATKGMRLYKQWHRPISKWFIKYPYSISRAASIDSDCCRLPTTSGVLTNNQNVPTPSEHPLSVVITYIKQWGRIMEQLCFSKGIVTPLILYGGVIFSRCSRVLL